MIWYSSRRWAVVDWSWSYIYILGVMKSGTLLRQISNSSRKIFVMIDDPFNALSLAFPNLELDAVFVNAPNRRRFRHLPPLELERFFCFR